MAHSIPVVKLVAKWSWDAIQNLVCTFAGFGNGRQLSFVTVLKEIIVLTKQPSLNYRNIVTAAFAMRQAPGFDNSRPGAEIGSPISTGVTTSFQVY